ncbi:hypothetical protein [Ruminococcus sp.]|uniref:hypothetical protein n=1 Tax=Ruminococcus sp. TaxID=41978 RepID=UPI001B3F8296|nr:hypothetical protein [Ruminococcus sp.]MBP5432672.1 hypothetical protein [Ruminococcus sp.]
MAFKITNPETALNNQGSFTDENSYTTSYIINHDNVIPTMLTVKETAVRFCIAQHYARQLALTGKVRAVRAGKKILINAQSVADYFNNCSLAGTKESIEIEKYHPVKIQ